MSNKGGERKDWMKKGGIKDSYMTGFFGLVSSQAGG